MKDLDLMKSQWRQIHNNKYNYSLIESYKNNWTKIDIICPEHGIFSQPPKNHSRGMGCKKCAVSYKRNKMSKTQNSIIEEFVNIHSKFYDYSLVSYKNNKTKVVVNCPNHGPFKITPSHHLNGHGCSKCSKNYRRSLDEFISDFNSVHNHKYDYSFIIERPKNGRSSVTINCPLHGTFSQNVCHHLRGCGCQKCKNSKGENTIQTYLEENKIEYNREKKFNDCLSELGHKLKFDFFLPKSKICIEYDGIQHFKPLEYFGGVDGFNTIKKNDKIKNEYCLSNDIRLIRIAYNQDINKKLGKYELD